MTSFIDTNVFIDFILEREGFYAPAASIISYAADRKVDIAVSSLTLVNANYICIERSKMPKDDYRRKMDFLWNFMIVYDVDETDIFNSYQSQWKDFEDGVQYYCASRHRADYIVTRNKKDFETDGIEILLPDEMLDIIDSAIADGL